MARKPFTPAEFAALPDDAIVCASELFSTATARGPYPFGRTRFWEDVADGVLPKGGSRGPGSPRIWRAGDMKAALQAMASETQEGAA